LGLNASTVYRKVKALLNELPLCADLSRGNDKHYCGILLVDGKYVHVKGYKDKIPVIYGIDYLTHDLSTLLFPEEKTIKHLFLSSNH
jgi:hypothetical protein